MTATDDFDRTQEQRQLDDERRRQEEALPMAPPDHLWLHDAEGSGALGDARRPLRADPELGDEAIPEESAPAAPSSKASERPVKAVAATARRTLGMRTLLVAGMCGIGLLIYLQMAPKPAAPVDLLGSSLPSGGLPEPTSVEVDPAFDPRLGGPDARAPRTLPTAIDLGHSGGAQPAEAPSTGPRPAASRPESQQRAAPTEELVQSPSVAAPPAASAPPAKSPSSEATTTAELQEQLRTTQALVAALTKQLADLQKAQDVRAPARPAVETAAPAPVVATASPTRAVTQPRPATQRAARASTRATAARPAVAEAPQSPTTVQAKPAVPLGGQLVAVDMWNGEPSVVVASGLAGDRRLRVLRPGDVVNGLALKSADPVSKSATFAAPGSAGLTLYVSQGG